MFSFLQAITDVDAARECLEKNPDERTEDDIEILLEFLQNLPVSVERTVYYTISIETPGVGNLAQSLKTVTLYLWNAEMVI